MAPWTVCPGCLRSRQRDQGAGSEEYGGQKGRAAEGTKGQSRTVRLACLGSGERSEKIRTSNAQQVNRVSGLKTGYSTSEGAGFTNNLRTRSLRQRDPTRNNPAKNLSATLIGSGTAVMMSRLQLAIVLLPPPPLTSAKNNVHSRFRSIPPDLFSKLTESSDW